MLAKMMDEMKDLRCAILDGVHRFLWCHPTESKVLGPNDVNFRETAIKNCIKNWVQIRTTVILNKKGSFFPPCLRGQSTFHRGSILIEF